MGKEEFKKLFEMHFDAIRRYLYYRCSDADLASDVAQDLFTRIWEKGMDLDPHNDKALLYKMASDMIVTKLRRKKVELNYISSIVPDNTVHADQYSGNNPEYNELAKQYSDALVSMPEKQRVAFLLSRNENLKYQEISQRLNISVKAVEKRVSGALEILRKKLSD
mgnify:CR=1 FL=1